MKKSNEKIISGSTLWQVDEDNIHNDIFIFNDGSNNDDNGIPDYIEDTIEDMFTPEQRSEGDVVNLDRINQLAHTPEGANYNGINPHTNIPENWKLGVIPPDQSYVDTDDRRGLPTYFLIDPDNHLFASVGQGMAVVYGDDGGSSFPIFEDLDSHGHDDTEPTETETVGDETEPTEDGDGRDETEPTDKEKETEKKDDSSGLSLLPPIGSGVALGLGGAYYLGKEKKRRREEEKKKNPKKKKKKKKKEKKKILKRK